MCPSPLLLKVRRERKKRLDKPFLQQDRNHVVQTMDKMRNLIVQSHPLTQKLGTILEYSQSDIITLATIIIRTDH